MIKYLIVPENVEIPAGLDKEVIVVRQPADHVYAGSNKTISLMEELGQLAENELRHFAYTDVEGVKRYLKEKEKKVPKL